MATYTGYNGWKFSDNDLDELWLKKDRDLEHIKTLSANTFLRINIGPEEEGDAKRRFAAAEYVLTERKKHSEERQSVSDKRKKTRANLLMQLKVAHTPNGQLVAAILEDEDGKTKEEIHNWCEELSALEDNEMDEILNNLCEDDVVFKTEGQRFYLNRICYDNLSFMGDTEFLNWAHRIICQRSNYYRNNRAKIKETFDPYLEVIIYIAALGDAFCLEDSIKSIDVVNLNRDEKLSDASVIAKFREFVKLGILIENDGWYSVPYLSERGRN